MRADPNIRGMQTEHQARSLCSAEDVAWRALCVGSLILRAHLENELKTEHRPADVVDRAARGLEQWMRREGADAHCSKKEQALLGTVPGGWSEDDIADVSWRGETLGMLCWALGMLDCPSPWDTQFALEPAVVALRLLEHTAPVIAQARLRPAEEVLHQRDVAEVWHWRARSDQLQRRAGLAPSPPALQAALQKVAQAGTVLEPLGGDFPTCGKPYRDLSPPESTRCARIAHERHYAMNWLCGYSRDWDKVPTDT